LVVAALDESGQEKQGEATAGVQRQYMGCAGRIANGVNTVYCTYATPGGHGLVGARLYVPADQLADPARCTALGIPDRIPDRGRDDGTGKGGGEGGGEGALEFKTKPQLAIDILTDMVADGTMPSWSAGDEVYGRAGELRTFLQDNEIGYVLRVGCAFHVEAAPGHKLRAEDLVARFTGPDPAPDSGSDSGSDSGPDSGPDSWQICSVAGSKGERAYAWAWIATTSPRHFLLVRKHLTTEELAYHYCYIPPGQPITLMTLVRVACLRWPVEEDFEFGKDHFGLDHSQVRLYPALLRHIVLTMAALAVCAVSAAQAKTRAPAPILPHTPDAQPPADTGLIALTVVEIKRLFMLVTRRLLPESHHLHWTWWRRRHQARARWYHHRARLRRQLSTT
jgi:SRSO17 transposase